jgi:hypothetical protein
VSKPKLLAELLGGTYAERMARAAEQGYVTDFLHGSPTLRESGAIDINYPNRTDAGYLGKAFYGTGPDNRFIAKAYAGNTGTVLDLKTNANRFKDFTYDENYRANIEEFGRSIGVETPMTSEDWPTIFAAKMQEAGYDGARGLADDGSVVELAIYDPSKVRSINADFNPANRDSSNLLAGIGGAAAIGGAALAPEHAEAHNALNNFQSRRASKRDYWRQMRQEIIDFANEVAGGAFAALDKPLQGYMGLAGVAGTLAAGGTLPQALQQGARIAAQPSEATAYQYGGAMTDALAPYSPQGAAIAGALTNAGIQLTSPF